MENTQLNSFASFETDNASRYLAMLRIHFGRKIETEIDINSGRVQFPFGRCKMTANKTKLEFLASAENQTRLNQVFQIVTSHLDRFAFRDNPNLTWQMSYAGTADVCLKSSQKEHPT